MPFTQFLLERCSKSGRECRKAHRVGSKIKKCVMKVKTLFFLAICFVLAAQMGAQSISITLENANAATMNQVYNVAGNNIAAIPRLYVGGVQCTNADYDPFLSPVVNTTPVVVPNMNIHLASSQGTFSRVKLQETNAAGVPLNGPYTFLADRYLEDSTVGFGLLTGIPNISNGLHYFKVTLIKGACNTDGRAKTFFIQYTKPNSTSGSTNPNGGNNGN